MHRRCFLVPVAPDALERYRRHLGFPPGGSALRALGRAIAATPGLPSCTLLLTPGSRPSLSFWGEFDEASASLLGAKARGLDVVLRRLVYLDARSVLRHCELLAERLTGRLGPGGVERAAFTAIPRGGLNVLGVLAYVLGLRRDQIGAGPGDGAELTVVVDDVALTGHRFGRFLKTVPGRVVFAHLLSHPALRSAIQDGEAAVEACLAAGDLMDRAADEAGAGLDVWRDRWLGRLPPPRYWIGLPDQVGFPWSEPDRCGWEPARGEVVTRFRVVPPDLCLANRIRARTSGIRVREQSPGKGPLRPSDRSVHLSTEERVLVADRESGEVHELEGAGGRFWRAILESGDEEGALHSLLGKMDVAPEILRADLTGFVKQLVSLGLLEHGVTSGPDGR